jgi:hypothetical protein
VVAAFTVHATLQVVEALQQAGVRCKLNVALDGPVVVDVALTQRQVCVAVHVLVCSAVCINLSISHLVCLPAVDGVLLSWSNASRSSHVVTGDGLSQCVLTGGGCMRVVALTQVGARYRVALQLHPHEDFAANPPHGALGPTVARWRSLQARGWRVSG